MTTTPTPESAIHSTTETSKAAGKTARGGKVKPDPAAAPKSKPVRIVNTRALVGNCPACSDRIEGDAVVEVHMVAHEGDGLNVTPETTTRVRSFRVAHACTPSA